MRRRIATIIDSVLLALGVALLLWIPASYWFYADLWVSSPLSTPVQFGSNSGALHLRFYTDIPPGDWETAVHFDGPEWFGFSWLMRPRLSSPASSGVAGGALFIPLWQLALLALAWPVASFVARRRRARRGFAVEAVVPASDAEDANRPS